MLCPWLVPMTKKSFFPRNITNIRPIRMILFSKYSARDALSMRQNGAEIGRIFVMLQKKQGKTTKVSMLLFRLLVLNEYKSDFRADC